MATVDDLLSRIHRQAAGLRSNGRPGRQLEAHLRAWALLATNATRALQTLDPRPNESPELYGLLRSLSRRPALGDGVAPDARVTELALTVGALADVVMSAPKVVASAGQAQRSRLQASIHAALHAAARSTADIARAAGAEGQAVIVQNLAETTELAALLPPKARVSTLERLTVTRLSADTVDGAVQLWQEAAERTFTNYNLITGIALQDAAATLALLTHTAADTLHQAVRRRIVDPDAGRRAARLMTDASKAWRHAAAWPSVVQLGGRAREHHDAVKAVRDALTGPPLTRLTLRGRVHTLRAAAGSAAMIGELQATAVTWLVNRGGLWVAHERANLRPLGVQRRHIKLDWEPMPWDHPAGLWLADRAHQARVALAEATAAVDQAVLPAPAVKDGVGHVSLVDNRLVWETIPSVPSVHRPDARAVALGVDHRPGIER